jgi:hypothetical protein
MQQLAIGNWQLAKVNSGAAPAIRSQQDFGFHQFGLASLSQDHHLKSQGL